MTEKKCVSRSALWTFVLVGTFAGAFAGTFAMMASGATLAASNRAAAEVTAAADAAAPSDTAKSGAADFASTNSAGVKTWDFDHDRGYSKPQDWTAVAGDWRVLIDPDAPSEPNTMGLPGYGLPHTR